MKIGEKFIIDERIKRQVEEKECYMLAEIGDEAFIDGMGLIKYLSGKHQNKVQRIQLSDPLKGYSHYDIAMLLTCSLLEDLAIQKALWEKDVPPEKVTSILFNALFEIL